MSRSGFRVASMTRSSVTGSPSEARTARPVSAGTIVTRDMPSRTSAKTLRAAVTVDSEPRARAAKTPTATMKMPQATSWASSGMPTPPSWNAAWPKKSTASKTADASRAPRRTSRNSSALPAKTTSPKPSARRSGSMSCSSRTSLMLAA